MKGTTLFQRLVKVLVLGTLLLVAALVAGLLLGPHSLSVRDILSPSGMERRILFHLRLPRVVMAALAGAALAMSGAVFQGLLRNPLAEPYTLGVSSGASLGAVVAILTGAAVSLWGMTTIPLFALAGALGSVLVVYFLARAMEGRASGTRSAALLLAGICMAMTFQSVILLAHYIADYGNSYRMLRWLMGGLGVVGYRAILQVLPLVIPGMVLELLVATDLNVLATGEDLARTKGTEVETVYRAAYFGASLSTAGVVAVVGPIGFVGLIVPHMVRPLTGPDHRLLLPASAAAGAAFLILCDTAARTLFAPAELPVGVLTALVGGPFTVAILLKRR